MLHVFPVERNDFLNGTEKTVENDPFLRLQMGAKEMFNRQSIFSTNGQYVKIKLIQNETNLWSIFLVKTKYW